MTYTINPQSTQDAIKQLEEIRERNSLRALQAIESMGTKYVCHPSNQVKKIKIGGKRKTTKNV